MVSDSSGSKTVRFQGIISLLLDSKVFTAFYQHKTHPDTCPSVSNIDGAAITWFPRIVTEQKAKTQRHQVIFAEPQS